MGLIENLFSLLFGSGRNVVAETVEVFRENKESGSARDATAKSDVLQQFAKEFGLKPRGTFDTIMDAINRIPRPALALGTLGLFISAMVDPVWFSQRMQGIALVPEPLWWLLGAIVSFYFGARHQVKSQDFQRSLAASIALTPKVVEGISALRTLNDTTPSVASTGTDAALAVRVVEPESNPALADWRRHGHTER